VLDKIEVGLADGGFGLDVFEELEAFLYALFVAKVLESKSSAVVDA